MTQVERLIRNLCEQRRQECLQRQRDEVSAVKTHHSWEELPAKVKTLVHEFQRIEQRQDQIVEAIRKCGYGTSDYELERMNAESTLSIRDSDKRKNAANVKGESARKAIEKIKTDATILALGKTAVEAQAILADVQAKLARV